MELYAKRLQQEQRAQQDNQASNGQQGGAPLPSCERCILRIGDVDDEAVIPQWLHRHQSTLSVEITRRAVVPTAVLDQPVPWRRRRHARSGSALRIRMTHQYDSVFPDE